MTIKITRQNKGNYEGNLYLCQKQKSWHVHSWVILMKEIWQRLCIKLLPCLYSQYGSMNLQKGTGHFIILIKSRGWIFPVFRSGQVEQLDHISPIKNAILIFTDFAESSLTFLCSACSVQDLHTIDFQASFDLLPLWSCWSWQLHWNELHYHFTPKWSAKALLHPTKRKIGF